MQPQTSSPPPAECASQPVRVHLKQSWDIDRHGAGCKCGQCNRNGKSYGVAIMPLGGEDPLEVEYACSEDSALHNARLTCQVNGWQIVTLGELKGEILQLLKSADCHPEIDGLTRVLADAAFCRLDEDLMEAKATILGALADLHEQLSAIEKVITQSPKEQ